MCYRVNFDIPNFITSMCSVYVFVSIWYVCVCVCVRMSAGDPLTSDFLFF